MNEEHYMNMAVSNLSYAQDELSRLINNLDIFLNINNNILYNDKINNLKNRIDSQIYCINNYIIPGIRSMYESE